MRLLVGVCATSRGSGKGEHISQEWMAQKLLECSDNKVIKNVSRCMRQFNGAISTNFCVFGYVFLKVGAHAYSRASSVGEVLHFMLNA